jgi:predicted DNA-binding transcriptional regulator YafY
MPTNKNALIRYKHLDRLLSDHHHYYDIHDLTEKVNDILCGAGYKAVTQRCIEKDLNAMEYELFSAPIVRFDKNGKHCISYGNYSFSIFKQEMSREERSLLREVLSTLGQFGGLDNFQWLDDFKIGLGLEERRPIISFSNNPYYMSDPALLGKLFDMISNEVVIALSYHTFTDPTVRCIEFHPYLLKQYNDRWFLIGAAESDKKILNFALDRIDKVEPLPEKKYAECPEDLYERFEDVVGVTIYDKEPEHILFWVSDASKDYVATKAIHGSQTQIKGETEQKLRIQYPNLEGGAFFTIDCIRNYELIRELWSYGKELLVLSSDDNIQDEIYKRICEMNENYFQVRTKSSQH